MQYFLLPLDLVVVDFYHQIVKKGKIFLIPFGLGGITKTLFQTVCDLSEENNFSSILYIAPTPRKVKETQMQLSHWVKAKAFIPPQFFTIKDFALKLYNQYGDKFILPDFLKPVLLQSLNPKIGIIYAQRIANFIKELKLYLFHSDLNRIQQAICHLLAGYESTLKRIDEAFQIYKAYNKQLQDKGWVDSEDIMLLTPTLIANLKDFILILDGFYALTPIEEEIIKALIKQSQKTIALAYFDENQAVIESYRIPQKFFQFLSAAADFEIVRLASKLGKIRFSAKYYGFPSLEEEVEGIAREIKKRFLENNLNLEKTVVTFSQLSLYSPLVERVFPKYGIPYTLIPKKNLKTSPIAITILELLKMIAEDFPKTATLIVLTNPFFPNIPSVVKNYLALFAKWSKIKKGGENWFYLKRRVEDYFVNEEILEMARRIIKETETGVRNFLNQIKNFMQGPTGLDKWVAQLKELLVKLGLKANLFTDDPTLHYEYELIIETLSELQRLSIDFATKSYSLNEFIKLLNFLFDRKEYEPDRKEHGIRVIDIKDTVGIDFDHLFFGGLIEGKFPNRPAKDPILSEAVRKHLNLPDIDYHFKLQELDYFRLLNSTETEPFLTYAQEEADQLLLPSPFLEGTPSVLPSDNYLLSEEEVLRTRGQTENIPLSDLIGEIDFSQDKSVLDLLATKYGGKYYFSVTELEKYRRCPFVFYIENVLAVVPEEESWYEVDALLWGNIAHQVLYRLYQNEIPSIKEIPKKFMQVLETVLTETKLSRFWQDIARKIFDRLIFNFVQIESELRQQGFVPYLLERHTRHEIAPNLRVKGRFDRIDRNVNKLRILDYKTGQVQINLSQIVHQGTHLQLPLYAKLMQLEKSNSIIDDIGIYSLREMKIKWLVKGKNNLAALIDAAVNFAQAAVNSIRQGKFLATTVDDQNCRNCNYLALCPKQK